MIGIIGTGLMGKGIALEFIKYGFEVIMISPVETEKLTDIQSQLVNLAAKDEMLKNYNSNIKLSHDYDELAKCKLIIEAIVEDLETKKHIFKIAKDYIKEDAIICSNTSSLSIKEIFGGLVDLKRVAGLHF